MKSDARSTWIRAALWIALGVAVGVGVSFSFLSKTGALPTASNDCMKMYPLTSDLLDCDSYDSSSQSLSNVDSALDSAVATYIQEGKAKRISVWVRDLDTNQWASTNENLRYAPASLMKLPLMIAYYKVAEVQPSLLDTEIVYTASSTLNDTTQDFVPAPTLVPGKSYTVEQVIEDMIINSDNNATATLIDHLDPTIFTNTLIDLGVKIPGSSNNYDFVTAKTYSSIFRMLYNASYLNRDYSEKALDLMSKEAFKGIQVPLPSSVVVAHKFGEREVDNTDGSVQTRELHDCGIVYAQPHAYSICVMTEGSSFSDLMSVIQNLSALAYQKI